MKYIFGIDGGGTKTECIVVNSENKVLLKHTGNPSNFLIIGLEKTSENLFKLIEECRLKLLIQYDDIEAIVLGTAGAGRKDDAENLREFFKEFLQKKGILFNNFFVESDARVALEGAFPGKAGSILIAGTGSIVIGKDSMGNMYRAGGFGRVIGDEGSGYSLGRKALEYVSKELDGRGTATRITELLAEKYNIKTPEELISSVYKHDSNFSISEISQLVLQAAEMSDPAAIKIIEDETDELILHIISISKKIDEKVLNISLAGGLLINDNIFSRILLEKIKARLLNVVIVKPEHSPAMGAVFLAKNLLKEN